jgi:3-methyladenine DNA glycosylase AlkD
MSITIETALTQLKALGDKTRAAEAAAYHKVDRLYWGVSVPEIDALAKAWRPELTLEERVDLASALWDSDIHEAKVAAAKLLTQARIKGDEPVWELIASWVPGFDAWAIADHACKAGEKRLEADPDRLDALEDWLESENMWTRRAALVMTHPFTKSNNPKPAELAARERVLSWCVFLAEDRDWFIQKAIAGWLRDLSKHDPERVAQWLRGYGPDLKKFARIEAAKYLPELQAAPVAEETLDMDDAAEDAAPVTNAEASGGDI